MFDGRHAKNCTQQLKLRLLKVLFELSPGHPPIEEMMVLGRRCVPKDSSPPGAVRRSSDARVVMGVEGVVCEATSPGAVRGGTGARVQPEEMAMSGKGR